MVWRTRMLNRPLCLVVLVLSVGLALLPRVTDGAVLPSAPASSPRASAEELNRLMTALERKAVATRLEGLGLSRGEVGAKLATLSDEELHRLAIQVDQLGAGGDGVAGAIAAVLIFALLIILILELLGRRVVSRP